MFQESKYKGQNFKECLLKSSILEWSQFNLEQMDHSYINDPYVINENMGRIIIRYNLHGNITQIQVPASAQ